MDILKVGDHEVFGLELNAQTGCLHYGSGVDIVAIRFKCCNRYYACYECHQAGENHPVERWGEEEFDRKAILCGSCGIELTIHQYLSCNHRCLNCKSQFNPRCKNHWGLYFIGRCCMLVAFL